jgi:hypothetical protein
LISVVELYHKRQGCYPDRLLADQIYRSRANISWCSERGIRLSGPRLGRLPKNPQTTRASKAQERRDADDRNVVEGVFGTTKTSYGIDCVAAKTEETTKTVISLAIMVFNLKKLLRTSLSLLYELLNFIKDGICWIDSRQWLPGWSAT